MCGLFGIASTGALSIKEKDFFESLGKISTFRGRDSTGIFAARLIKYPTPDEKNKGITFYYSQHKDICEPAYFFNRKDWKDIRTSQNHIYMGHNRYATVGGVTKAAAHPFVIHDKENDFVLAGMHNGTLYDYVDVKGEHHSDSHKLYTKISEVGLRPALEELKERSAYALVFIDGDLKPTFFRNSKRPLYFGLTKNKKTLVWASEERFIKATEALHDIGIEEITLLGTNTLVKVDVSGEEVRFVIAKDYLKKEVIELHEKEYTAYTNTHYNGNHISHWRGGRRVPNDRPQYSVMGGWDDLDAGENPLGLDTDYGNDIYLAAIRRQTEANLQGASTHTDIAYTKSVFYNPNLNRLVLEKGFRNNVSRTTTTYLYPECKDFWYYAHIWEEQEHERLGIPYLMMGKADEIICQLNASGKKKKSKKEKVFPKSHHLYYGWLQLFEDQEQDFEMWIYAPQKCDFKLRFSGGSMSFNALNKEAAKITREYRAKKIELAALKKKRDEEEAAAKVDASPENTELPTLPSFITETPKAPVESPPLRGNPRNKAVLALPRPAGAKQEVREALDEMFRERTGTAWMDGLLYDTGWSNDAISLVVDKLSNGCQACGNPKVVQDKNMWINSEQFVCETCSNKQETKDSIPALASAKQGRVFRSNAA
jgi:hypothetical protein